MHLENYQRSTTRPKSGHPRRLLDYFIGTPDHRIGNGDAERLCGLEINDQFDFRGLHDGQLGRLFTF